MILELWLSLLCTAILCLLLYVTFLLKQLIAENKARMSYIVEKVDATDRNNNTLARVINIYEEETKILQKRKEQIQAKERITDSFKTRTPR